MIDKILLENELMKCNKRLRVYPFEAKTYISRGMVYFKLARLTSSLQDFNQAEKLNPQLTPYLWQRGLTYYYLGKYAQGARQFELDLSVQSQDLEETLWYYLCLAQLENASEIRDCLLKVRDDPRPIMGQVYQFYGGKCSLEQLLAMGKKEGLIGLFYSNLYLGLYYEAHKKQERSQFYINQAVKYQTNDYLWYLACVHQQLRGAQNSPQLKKS